MDSFGFAWEAYKVETEDGWFLTLFRILADTSDSENKDKPPILMQHGAYDSAFNWAFASNTGFMSLPGQLATRGYDVWMGSNRGVKYSNANRRDGLWSLKERWDFSWAEMGLYDIPAMIDKIIEVTGKPKVTLMGYS